MKKDKLFWALAAVAVLNFAAHLCVYPTLPDTVPIHWGADGVANGWGDKSMVLVLGALPLGLLLLMQVVQRIDPKAESYEKFSGVWKVFQVGLVLFMSAVSWLSELAVWGVLPDSGNAVGILAGGGIGVLFIVLGNYMPRVKQNYSFGCKTPWALHDEHNWNRTQRMGGYTFVVMGLALLVSAVFAGLLGDFGVLVLTVGVTLGGTAWIYLYSYLVFCGKMK